MIQFRHLKVGACPTCGERTVVAERVEVSTYGLKTPEIRQHTNGQRWEHRRFLCGCEVEWVPNYEAAWVSVVCPQNPTLIETNKKIAALQERQDSIRILMAELETDKSKLRDEIIP